MIKVFAFLLIPALVAGDDILEVIECEASFGDHVIPSPEFCDRCYPLNSDSYINFVV